MSDRKINTRPYVSLNVGGRLFRTTLDTLSKCDNHLRTMVLNSVTDEHGWILIDRSGKHFETILNYLRDGSVALPTHVSLIEEILAEAQYYLINGLILTCQQAIQQNNQKITGNVKLISTPEEQKNFIWLYMASLYKPLILMTLNSNNKNYNFCYGTESILLKHVELFFKLSRRFGDRAIFVIDSISKSSTVCAWQFYRYGLLIEQVPCTFTKTEPKTRYNPETHKTEIIYPEGQIIEEALAIFLVEKSDVPKN